jgi:hypothetical protein
MISLHKSPIYIYTFWVTIIILFGFPRSLSFIVILEFIIYQSLDIVLDSFKFTLKFQMNSYPLSLVTHFLNVEQRFRVTNIYLHMRNKEKELPTMAYLREREREFKEKLFFLERYLHAS